MSLVDGIVFDLDGTLVDTLHDIALAMNHALHGRGLPTHPVGDYRVFVGEGLARLVAQVTAGLDAPQDALADAFLQYYDRHMTDHSAPYPGIPDLLHTLQARRVPLAVLSNKPHDATRAMVDQLFPDVTFAGVLGQREGVPRKPAPDGALEAARLLAVPAHRCGFIGDTAIDMATARAAGMVAIGVTWGFRDAQELLDAGATRLLGSPGQLLELVAATAPVRG